MPLNNLNNGTFGYGSLASVGLCTEVEGRREQERGPSRVRAPPPPIQAPDLWCMAAERDELIGTRSLPRSPSHGADPTALLDVSPSPRGGGPSHPHANKAACRPASTNTGVLGCCGATDATSKRRKKREKMRIAPLGAGGYLWATGGFSAPHEWLMDSIHKMHNETPSKGNANAPGTAARRVHKATHVIRERDAASQTTSGELAQQL